MSSEVNSLRNRRFLGFSAGPIAFGFGVATDALALKSFSQTDAFNTPLLVGDLFLTFMGTILAIGGGLSIVDGINAHRQLRRIR